MPLDDLPGLDDEELPEPNEPGPDAPATEPAATEPPAKEPLASTETESPQWTSEELDDWWEHDGGGDQAFGGDPSFSGWLEKVVTHFGDPDFSAAYWALRDLSDLGYGAPLLGEGWDRLSHEMKEKFRRGWEVAMAPQANPEPDPESVVPGLAPYGPAYDGPVGLVGGSVVDQIAPYPLSDGHAIDSKPKKSLAIGVGGAVGVGVAIAWMMGLFSQSTPSASVDVPTDEPSAAVAVDKPSGDVEEAPPVTEGAATEPAGLSPLPGHIVLGVNQTALSIFPGGIVVLDMTQTLKGDVPTNPDSPTEYRLFAESTNGQQIEKALSSSGGGEPFTCVLLLNGVETAPPETTECGITGADGIRITLDLSPLAPGNVSWGLYTEETQPDGTLLGDQLTGGGDENSELP